MESNTRWLASAMLGPIALRAAAPPADLLPPRLDDLLFQLCADTGRGETGRKSTPERGGCCLLILFCLLTSYKRSMRCHYRICEIEKFPKTLGDQLQFNNETVHLKCIKLTTPVNGCRWRTAVLCINHQRASSHAQVYAISSIA